ncbi:MAG: PEP-CTERM sorting domain-containing protein [Verrucomicrobiales bacterium]|nr:PEP-CTERM sorting domain-containing protein [Verrucomicrobiales bacterium]
MAGNIVSWANKDNFNRAKTLSLTDDTFTNSGIVNLQQLGSTGTAVNLGRNLTMQLSGTNGFTNSNRLLILNSTPDISTADQFAQFTMNSGATLENGSDAAIAINNSASGTANSDYAQYARLTVSDGATFTNSGSITVSLDAAVTDDAQHYATLLIGADWTNNGVITVNRANKTTAVASLDLPDKAYTQTGADAVTRLLSGGQLNAASVTISEGLLGGNGVISAVATISDGATLDPDGTLTPTSLTLDAGSILNFSLTDLDLLNITGNLTLSGATLNLTDSEVSTGIYSIANYGTLTDGYALTVSGLSDEYTYELDFITDSTIRLTVIPEPATWVLLLTGALTLAALRRR